MTQIEIDKLKIEAFRVDLNILARAEVKTIEAAAIVSIINGELARLNKFIETEINKL